MSNERVHWIDIARGIFILAIVLGHILSNGKNLIRWWVFSFHVPAFFFLSGLCFNNGNQGFIVFLKKKLRSIVVPYFLMSVISIILFGVAGLFLPRINEFVDNPVNNIIALLYSNSNKFSMRYNLPLWFLPCLFSVEIVAYVVKAFAERLGKALIYIVTMAFSVFVTISIKIYLPWHIETAGAMLFWFVAGMLIRDIKHAIFVNDQRSKEQLFLSIALVFVGGGITFLNIHNVSVRRDLYGLYWNYFISAAISITGFCLLSMWLRKSRILEYLGNNTLSILLLHKFPILVFQELIPQTGKYLKETVSISGTLIALVVLCITILLCLIGDSFIKRWMPCLIGK